jgi:hypothetical protein
LQRQRDSHPSAADPAADPDADTDADCRRRHATADRRADAHTGPQTDISATTH